MTIFNIMLAKQHLPDAPTFTQLRWVKLANEFYVKLMRTDSQHRACLKRAAKMATDKIQREVR